MGGGMKRSGGAGHDTEAQPSKRPKISKVPKEDALPVAIFSRLPAHYVARGAAVSNRWRKVLTGADFWLHRYLRPIPDVYLAYLDRGEKLPRKFSISGFQGKHVFNLAAGHTSSIAHGLPFAGSELSYRFFGSCNGLVAFALEGLANSSSTCVIANPATSQQLTALVMDLSTMSRMLAFGYDPIEDKYKVFAQRSGDVCVVPLNGAGGKPMTVISGAARTGSSIVEFSDDTYSLCIAGVCYVLLPPIGDDQPPQENTCIGAVHLSPTKSKLLAFHVQRETASCIEMPEHDIISGVMEISNRVCIATSSSGRPHIRLFLLTSDLNWEPMCSLATISASPGGRENLLLGAWYCRERLVLWFGEHGLGLYDLSETTDVGAVRQPTQTCGLQGYEVENEKLLRQLHSRYQICYGYRPTLLAPGSVVGKVCVATTEDRVIPFMSSGRIVPEEPPMKMLQTVASTALALLG